MDMCQLSEAFLFPDVEIPEKFHQKFFEYIEANFKRIGCCVLWDRDPELVQLIRLYNLPPLEKKEVRMESHFIQGSLDYMNKAFCNLA